MKIAILSDFHLGYKRFAADALAQATEALTKAAESADAILIPGDIFDFREPDPETFAEAIILFRDLSKRNWSTKVSDFKGDGEKHTEVPIIAIPGTHERRAVDVEDPVDILSLAGFLVDISNASITLEKDGEKVSISGIGGISEERFKGIVNEINPKPKEGMFSVFMFHQSVYELLPFSDGFIKEDELPKGFDLYVCGHIHSRVERKVHGKPFLIPGSTVLTQLKDGEQDGKGFYLFDTEKKSYEYKKISSRKFVVAKVNIDGKKPEEITKQVENAIDNAIGNETMPIVRVIVEGTPAQGFKGMDINLHEINKRYKEKAIVEISRNIVEGVDSEKNENLRKGMLGDLSVKDYGSKIFIDKLKQSGYNLKISADDLFEMLSSEEAKDKVVKKSMEKLLE